MRSTISAAAFVVSALQLVQAQTFTDCDPTKTKCDPDEGYGPAGFDTDFTKSSSLPAGWKEADGTKLSFGDKGADFAISTKVGAPTLSSLKHIMFGKVDVVARGSKGKGIVSSFILESSNLDEIDWEWVGSDDGNIQSNFFGKGDVTTYDRGATHAVSTPLDTFHKYTIDWTKDYIKWLIDDVEVRSLSYNDPLTHGGSRFPQTPMKIKFGSWVGCATKEAETDPKTKGTCEWAGGAADFGNGASYHQYVKSVTIKDNGCGGEYTYSDSTGSYQSIKSSNEKDGACIDGPAKSPSSSGSVSSASKAVSSSATSTGAVLAQTSTAASSANSTTAAASSTTAVVPLNTATNGVPAGGNQTTLATANGGSTPQATAPSGTASGPAASVTASAANTMKPKHKYGMVDVTVIALGLGLGYLVM